MNIFSKNKVRRSNPINKAPIAAAIRAVVETIESRVLLSTTVAAWTFDQLASQITSPTTTTLSPAASTGTGTALTVGLQSSSSNSASPGGVYAYPNANASGTGDISDILNGTGNNKPATSDNSSTGQTAPGNSAGVNPAWRLRGSSDGWSSNALVGTQGAQFSTSTAGDSGITVSFDIDASSASAPSEVGVEYSTDGGNTWNTVPAADLSGGISSNNGATDGISVANGAGVGSNVINGGYFQIANNTDSLFWQNGETVNLSGISAVNNDSGFAFRIVNAASGAAEFEVGGTGFPTAGEGNWRLDNFQVTANGAGLSAPAITTQPVNQTVAAGQSVTFTAAASGSPAPTVQWFEGGTPGTGGNPGTGTPISGATSTTYTFTTSSTAADNGNTYYAEFSNSQGLVDTTAATLTDTLAAPVVTTQPSNVTTSAGNTVTFTAAASGSPVPTVQWQVSTDGGNTWSNDTTDTGNTTGTLTVTAASHSPAYEYRADFSNSQAANVYSNAATLSTGGVELTAWNFASSGTTTYAAGQTVLNVGASVGTGTGTSLGMGAAGTYSVYIGDPAAAFTLTVTDSSGTYTTASIATGTSASSIQSTLRALNPATTGSITCTTSPTAGAAMGVVLNDPGATLSITGSTTAFAVLDAQATSTGLTSAQVTGSPDDSNMIAAADTGSPNGDPSATNAWRIVGTNGWNSNAPIGTQGAQFLTSTATYSSIETTFDLYATAQGEAKLEVEYTTDGSTWTNVPAADLSIGSGDTGISVQNNTNSSDTNTVQGAYFDITSASANSWYNALGVNLAGVSGVNNNANFGIRIVNAATGAANVNITGVALNNSSGNDRIADVQITADNPVAPTITTQPTSQSVAVGSTATFTAVAYGYPTPTVQWQVSADNGSTWAPDTADSGNTTDTLSVVASAGNSGHEYRAVFTNSVGTTTSSPATLLAGPQITTQPASQYVGTGSTVTLTAAAIGTPTPTVQWYTGTPGSGTAISGATSTTYTFTATETATGTNYYAVFTNTGGTVTTMAAQVTVTGTPITEWDFTAGLAPSPDGNTSFGTGNSPAPSLQGSSTDQASTIGLQNDYTGVQAVPESDILPNRSTLNSNFNEYVWRIRSGNGSGPTGSPGTPEGWSQFAPQYNNPNVGTSVEGEPVQPQGVVFDVNTTGYSNVTLHFDWNQGGIGDMQAQYSPDGGNTWYNVGGLITATGNDYYGITSTTNPTGVLVNLQGITAANNNPNLQVRLVTAYDPSLPQIDDGNQLDSTLHGQYSKAGYGGANAIQAITINDSSTFTLSFNGQTTAPITLQSGYSNLTANASAIATALSALSSIGANNVSVLPNDGIGLNYTVEFKGTKGNAPQNLMTISDSNDTVTTWQVGNTGTLATSVNAPYTLTANSSLALSVASSSGFAVGNTVTVGGIVCQVTSVATGTMTVTPQTSGSVASGAAVDQLAASRYVDGGGAWQLGNINFFGDVTSGAPGITSEPVSTTATDLPNQTAVFTASAYSATLPTVQWEVSTNNGNTWNPVTTGTVSPTSFTLNSTGSYTSTYTLPIDSGDTNQNGYQYMAVFSNSSGSTNSHAATLTVLAPVAPSVVVQPVSQSVQQGTAGIFSTTVAGSPAPTVQWQINTGSGWTNLTDGGTVTGSQTTTLYFTTANNTSQNGDLFRVAVTNAVGTIYSNPATLTVLAPETTVTDWNFSAEPTSGNAALNNSPAPTGGVVDVGTAIPVGMVLPFNQNDPATGTNGVGAVPASDFTSSPGVLNPDFAETTWRVRSGPTATTGGTPANGWSNLVPQYSQGAQFSVPTTGYNNIYVTLDWYSTTSGELDAQEQYTVGGTTAAITGESIADNGVVTITANNSFKFGDEATVTGLPTQYDGTWQVISSNGTSFTYEDATYPATGQATGSGNATGSVYVPTWVNINNPIQAVSNDFYGATAGQGATTITSVSLTSNVATVLANNNFAVGESVNVTGVTPAQFDGTFVITAASSGSFSYALTGSNVTATTQAATANADVFGLPVPVLINLSGISGVANNPNFGVRLVNAYDPYLSNTQSLVLGDTSNFTLTFNGQTTGSITYSSNAATMAANVQNALSALSSVGTGNVTVTSPGNDAQSLSITFGGALSVAAQPSLAVSDSSDAIGYTPQYANAALVGSPAVPAAYNGSKGNWRFDNIVVHGVSIAPTLPAWLSVSSGGQVTWNQSAETLEIVSGTATIVADPNESTFNSGAGDEPVITVDNGATLNIAPTDGSLMVHIGGLTLASGATAVVQQLQGPSTYDQMIGEFVASSDASNHEVLVVGKLGAANDPTFSIDPNSTLNMENNDLIIHTGSNDAGGYNELAYVQGLAYGSPFGTGVGGRAGGAWNGKGLTSSVAQAQDYSDGNESVQLAVVDNTDLGSPFNTTSNKYSVGSASEGLNPNGDIIVKYTYTGDFNLAGSVTSADVNIFGLYYDAGSSTGNEWAYGDTNNDGKLNATDANILGLEYGNGTSNGTDPYQL